MNIPNGIHRRARRLGLLFQLVIGGILLLILSACTALPGYLFPTPEPTRQIISSTLPLTVKWQVTESERFRYLPFVYEDFLFTRSKTTLTVRDAKTGNELWTETAGSFIGDVPLIDAQDNVLAFAEEGDRVIKVLDLRQLKVLWTRGTGLGLSPWMNSLSIDGDGVYASWWRPSHVEKYDLKTGALVWRQGGGTWGVTGPLVPYGDNLYVFDDRVVHILDKKTGALTREYDGRGVVQGREDMFLELSASQLRARNLQTGNMLWQVPLNDSCGSVWGIVDGRVYATSECNRLLMLDAGTGRVIWRDYFGAEIHSPVIEIGSIGYVMLRDGTVIGFDVTTGKKIGELVTSPATTSPLYHDGGLATDGNMLFVTFADHQLFALGK